MKILDLPIAMLHHVSNKSEWNSMKPFVIREETFLRFLNTLEQGGYVTTTFQNLKTTSPSKKKKSVIITFDDCGAHLLDFVVPELIRRRMSAVFYIPTAQIGGYNEWNVEKGMSRVPLMDAADLVYLKGKGMEIGAHSHDHVHLARISVEQQIEQFKSCQRILTNILGTPCTSFCYPYGSIPEDSAKLLEDNGFEEACAIFSPNQSNHQLRRFIVHDKDTPLSLRLKLSPAYSLMRFIKDARMSKSSWT
jgi:peptidoglycan/xylan/chitin deacetylase (PgdA/CDA1 family)